MLVFCVNCLYRFLDTFVVFFVNHFSWSERGTWEFQVFFSWGLLMALACSDLLAAVLDYERNQVLNVQGFRRRWTWRSRGTHLLPSVNATWVGWVLSLAVMWPVNIDSVEYPEWGYCVRKSEHLCLCSEIDACIATAISFRNCVSSQPLTRDFSSWSVVNYNHLC